jgi:hypothetical protein
MYRGVSKKWPFEKVSKKSPLLSVTEVLTAMLSSRKEDNGKEEPPVVPAVVKPMNEFTGRHCRALLDLTARLWKMAKQSPPTYGSRHLVEHCWLLSFSSKLLWSFHQLLHLRKLAIPNRRLLNDCSLAHRGQGVISVQVAVLMLEVCKVHQKCHRCSYGQCTHFQTRFNNHNVVIFEGA